MESHDDASLHFHVYTIQTLRLIQLSRPCGRFSEKLRQWSGSKILEEDDNSVTDLIKHNAVHATSAATQGMIERAQLNC